MEAPRETQQIPHMGKHTKISYLNITTFNPHRVDTSSVGPKVRLSRTDSVRTHESIKILEENLSLLDCINEKEHRCRFACF